MDEFTLKPQSDTAEKKRTIVFLLIAFGIPYLMGIPLGICQRGGYAVDIFPNAQMFYPAAGVIFGRLLYGRRQPLTKRYDGFYLVVTLLFLGLCAATAAVPAMNWMSPANVLIVAASVLAWIFLLTEKKENREACGLRWHGGFAKPAGVILLFILLRTGTVFVSVALEGGLGEYLGYWKTGSPWLILAVLLPNFFLSFLPFFGEEYGWRYFLQPLLQKKFGPRAGVLLLGVAWGLWHLPLNLFYYSPETSLQSIVAQIITCVALGVFFAFAYMKTNNIWVPVILHYLNNNLIVVYTSSVNISNQVYRWRDILLLLVIDAVFYLPFLASKVFAAKRPELPAAEQ